MFEILDGKPNVAASLRAGSVLIKGRTRDGVDILDLEGALEMVDGVEAFETLIKAASKGKSPLLLNLAGLSRVDSRGIGAIVDARVKLGSRVCMIHVSQRIQSLLAICKLTTVMPNYSSETEAVECLQDGQRSARLRSFSIPFFD
jgi:anti-anti-sigma factor